MPAPSQGSADTALVKARENLSTLRALIDRSASQIRMALPKHMDVQRLTRIALTSLQRTPRLLECDPITVIGALMQCAQLGLYPDGVTNEAHLVPFWNSQRGRFDCQLIPGYRGLCNLARRTGLVSLINSQVVYDCDHFDYQEGTNAYIEHRPKLDRPENAVMLAAYSVATFKDGKMQFVVMPRSDIEKIKGRVLKRIKAKGDFSSTWETDEAEMWKKTATKRLWKMLPSNAELATAIALDDRDEAGVPQDLGVLVNADELGTEKSRADAVRQPQRASAAAEKSAAVDENKQLDKEIAEKEKA